MITAGAKAAVLGIVVLASARADDIATPTFTTNATVHDPSIVRAGDTYYVFGSHMASAKSTDLMNWTQISTSAAAPNPLIRNSNPQTEFAEALTWAQTTTFWAPDVVKLGNGKYALYYCACKGDSPLSALGLATADAIEGPYANVGLLLKSGMAGMSPAGVNYNAYVHPNVVDPSVFYDPTGKLWMVYGSFSGGLFILQLDPNTGELLPNQGYGKKLIGGNHARIEGPYIIYNPSTQYYYLFFTFGGLDAAGGYNIRVGRSRSPDGPYVDAAGNDLTAVAGSPNVLFDDASIAPYAVKLMGNYQFAHATGDAGTQSRGYISPGGVSVYRDAAADKYVVVFHTRFVARGEQHEVRVHQLFFNQDGWPVVAPHRYAQETLRIADVGQLPGDYKLINHGKDITSAVKASSIVTLKSDGTVTGAATGTWQLSGDHFIALTLGGATYRGVVARLWDDDNTAWVQTFSAVANDGVAIWGSKVTTPAPLTIVTQPAAQSAAPGQTVTFSVATSGSPAPTYQWRKNGVAIAGATSAKLTLASVSSTDSADYSVVVTNSAGSVTSSAGKLTISGRPDQVVVANGDLSARILNLSTRGIVATGENSLIAGFVLRGPVPKKLLILASGKNLTRFGVTGEIGRPRMELVQRINGTNVSRGENSDWLNQKAEISALSQQVGAQTLTDSADAAHGDAGMAITLEPGVYTVVVSPASTSANQDGIGLIEIYDCEPNNGSRLSNLSTRGRIETGDRQMIVGVVVGGSGQARLLVRGVGPTLRDYGITQPVTNPKQSLLRRQNNAWQEVGANDDWWSSAQADQMKQLATVLGAFPLGEGGADASILQLLAPGVYTTLISSGDGTPGVALAEMYDAYQP